MLINNSGFKKRAYYIFNAFCIEYSLYLKLFKFIVLT